MATTRLSLEKLRDLLAYDPLTGFFTWKVSRGRVRAGAPAGSIDSDTGYWRIRLFGVLLYGHHLAWAFVTNAWPTEKLDHRNTVRTDNRFENLRLAGLFGNAQNCGLRSTNTSGLKGARFYPRDGVWIAEITAYGKYHYLGRYGSKETAHQAYLNAAAILHGQFARAA